MQKNAAETVVRAEAFVSTVGRAFALNESPIANNLENDSPNSQDKISEPDLSKGHSETGYEPANRPVGLCDTTCIASGGLPGTPPCANVATMDPFRSVYDN